MAKPPKHLSVPDNSGTRPQNGKVGGYFRSYEYISNQTTINHTRPTRGGTIRHHQIALEHHHKTERLEFIFVLTNTYPTRPPSSTHAQRGAERFDITRLLWNTTAKRKGWSLVFYYRKQTSPTKPAPHLQDVGKTFITRLLWCTHAKRKVHFLKKTNGPCN
jgi:hypothetical protein